MKEGDKYLKGFFDLGAIGEVNLLCLPNEKKKEDKEPDFFIYTQNEEDLKKVGVLWVNYNKPEQPKPTGGKL